MKKQTRTVVVGVKRRVYFAVMRDDGRWTLGIATENEPGYHLVKSDSDIGGAYENEGHARATANACNSTLGFTPKEAALIVASSIAVSDVRSPEGGSVKRRPMRHRRRGP